MRLRDMLAAAATLAQVPIAAAVVSNKFGQFPDPCPIACSPQSEQWTRYIGLDQLDACQDPIVFRYNMDKEKLEAPVIIRACSMSPSAQSTPQEDHSTIPVRRSNLGVQSGCGADTEKINTILTSGGSSAKRTDPDAEDTATAALNSFLSRFSTCGTEIIFAKANGAAVGFYSGAGVQKASTTTLFQSFRNDTSASFLQACEPNGKLKVDTTIGIVRGTMESFETIHLTVRSWVKGGCVETKGSDVKTIEIQLNVSRGSSSASNVSGNGTGNATLVRNNTHAISEVSRRAGGDCQIYSFQPGEGCWDVATKFGITKQDIEDFNKKTWGWPGCDDGNIQLHQVICVSKGNPPMPPTLPDVQCGPQKVGTVKPEGSFDFNSLNPCPLNACCDVWGYCGMTEEFCTPTASSSGAPGTAAKGTNGCISNCGMDIKQSDPPVEFKKVAYFESWNYQRSCLHMSVDNLPSGFTHVHFAFATVSPDWNVVIDDKIKGQFEKFKQIKNVKKILSFGGWAFSTESGTFQRFRDATKPENRDAFAANAAKFLADNNLDGLDFDWEYPGAPDIPNVPPGGSEEGPNYLKFLVTLKKLLPAGKSLSIALPSSFWYLRPYPVALMSRTVDYFIYMTYDLHGQWDYGNKWTSPGCATGNCIRSHVNITETKTALAMITKAGVPSNKVIVGLSSYGRSFRLHDGGCTGPMCLFTGSPIHSDAYKGRCTDTSGYISNAELAEIKASRMYSTVNYWYDQASDSNLMVYGNGGQLDWVAYMDDDIKARRTSQFKGYNMGGTTDWAVDLAAFQPGDGGSDGGHPGDPTPLQCKDSKDWPDSKGVFGGIIPPLGDSAHYRLFNIINLTPHRFVIVGHHEYQYSVFSSNVEPWTTAPNHFSRALFADNPVDDKAEVYYELEGTGLKFSVLLRTHTKDQPSIIWDLTDMGLGSRETWPLGGSNLVILGSKATGFRTSLRTTPWHSGWMQSIKSTIANRTLRQMIVPGTHDSAMSRISGMIAGVGSSASNTQTQGQTIYNQLRMGARWFDLRIASVHHIVTGNADFWGAHVNNERAEVCTGNSGEMLDEIIDEINRFTSENPGEVIVFKVRYLIGIRSTPSLGPIYWDQARMDQFVGKLRGVNNRCLNLNEDIGTIKMGQLMDQNQGKGCVFFLLDPSLELGKEPAVKYHFPADGVYTKDMLNITDDWANSDKMFEVVNKETAHWQSATRLNQVHIAQWIITSTVQDVLFEYWNIAKNAIESAAPSLFSKGVNQMSPHDFPNVILLDYFGQEMSDSSWDSLTPDVVTLVIGLNYVMLSRNCDFNTVAPPLMNDPPTGAARSKVSSMSKSPKDSDYYMNWNGFISGNGTVYDEPLPDALVYTGIPEYALLNMTTTSTTNTSSTNATTSKAPINI